MERYPRKKDTADLPFIMTDVHGKEPLEAKDSGEREYPKVTLNFKNKMYEADIEVEHLLINEITSVLSASASIHRLGKRIGREETREVLKDIRLNGWQDKKDLTVELMKDIELANQLEPRNKIISIDQLKKGFEVLFVAEKHYFDAVVDLPWNKIGPEPFDILIDVFWFRFNYWRLNSNWENREKDRKLAISEVYKDAQIERILSWLSKTHNLYFNHLKELHDSGIQYNMKEVESVAGPLFKYINKEKLAERAQTVLNESRPSELTLLLWKTLKWAGPSEWRANAVHFSELTFVDNELWDEKIPDENWLGIGDLQGRLVLSGETLERPLSHIKKDELEVERQIEKELIFNTEETGGTVLLSEVVQEKQFELTKKEPKSFESVVDAFSKIVSSLPLNELFSRIDKLTSVQRIIVLHRLGYDIAENQSGIESNFESISIKSSRPVMYIVRIYFKGHQNRYYNEIKRATKKLLKPND